MDTTEKTIMQGLPAKAAPSEPGFDRGFALVMLLIGAFLPPLDFYIVNLALPAIQAGLRTTSGQLQLIISCYASAYAVFLITGGRLGDLYGRKRMFMVGMTGFVLGSVICGLAPDGPVLIGGRIIQGAAAAVMVPQVLATIRTLFPAKDQPKVIGLYGSMFGLAAIAGQLFGGALITLHPLGLTWQSIFLINVPLGIGALIGAAKFLRSASLPEHCNRRNFMNESAITFSLSGSVCSRLGLGAQRLSCMPGFGQELSFMLV
jgi:MFS family permease